MGAIRQITYATMSNMAAAATLITSAGNWGELKKSEVVIATLSSGMTAMLDNGTKFSNDSDILPEGDFSIYFVLEKNNSGL